VGPLIPLNHSQCISNNRSKIPSQSPALCIQLSVHNSLYDERPAVHPNVSTNIPVSHSPCNSNYRSAITFQLIALLYGQLSQQNSLTAPRLYIHLSLHKSLSATRMVQLNPLQKYLSATRHVNLTVAPQLPLRHPPCFTPSCRNTAPAQTLAMYIQQSLRSSLSVNRPAVHSTVQIQLPLSHSKCIFNCPSTAPSQPIALLYIQMSHYCSY